MRMVIRDYRKRINREIVDSSTSRLPSRQWCHFTACSFFMNLRRTGSPGKFLEDISTNIYEKGKQLGKLFGYDGSSSRLGRTMTRNWIGLSQEKINPYTHKVLSKDMIRTLLKKSLYPSTFARI